MKNRITGIEYSADATIRYVGPDGMALHPGDRVSIEPPAIVKKRNIQRLDMPQEVADWLERFAPWARREIAKAGNVPEKLAWGEFEPPRCDAGNIWRWPGFDALKITNPEVMILGKDDRKMLNVKGIDEKELLAALYNAAQKATEETVGAVYDDDVSPERAGLILYGLTGGDLKEKVYIKKMYGRHIYMEFWCGMTQIDCTMYDAHNGYGKAAEVVETLRREIAEKEIAEKEIAAKKEAEQKAKKAKRHRVAVYWQDGSERMDIVTNGEPGRCLYAVAMLLGTLLVRVPKDKRDLALRMVQGRAAALAKKYEAEGNADD